jgi:4-hydroxythreonine-4-phosphate dehydrogenase
VKANRSVIGITLGDPAGIGPEIVVRTLLRSEIHEICLPLVFGDEAVLEQAFEIAGRRMAVRRASGGLTAEADSGELLLVPGGIVTEPVVPGRVSETGGRAAYAYFEEAIRWAMDGRVESLCTAPLNKQSLHRAGCSLQDHTAILRELTGSKDTTTMFAVENLRIFFMTRHIPLKEVAHHIRRERVLEMAERCTGFLRQLGIEKPRLAVAALNPHGGEGLFGDEEREIEAAVTMAENRGTDIAGPIPADSVFHLAMEGNFDGVLSLYHDQGHIAAKTLDFHRTVSFTLGMPFLRTSVDHGTAFDIAGKGIANETSMVEAVKAAAKYGPLIRRNRI